MNNMTDGGKIMSIYLVDYENVSLPGLEGIERLNDKETVYIFYGNSAGSISFEMHAKISQTRAHVHYIKTERSGKNYLDFQLATLGGYLVATTEETRFIIVSKDTGFESVVDFWNQQSMFGRKCTFSRQEKINENTNTKNQRRANNTVKVNKEEKAEIKKEKRVNNRTDQRTENKPRLPKLEERYKKEIRELVREECSSPKDFAMIYRIVVRTSTEELFRAQLMAAFKKDKGGKLYEIVLPVYNRILTERQAK